jgi:hypothetical protein
MRQTLAFGMGIAEVGRVAGGRTTYILETYACGGWLYLLRYLAATFNALVAFRWSHAIQAAYGAHLTFRTFKYVFQWSELTLQLDSNVLQECMPCNKMVLCAHTPSTNEQSRTSFALIRTRLFLRCRGHG